MINIEYASRRCVIIFEKAFYTIINKRKAPLRILIVLSMLVAKTILTINVSAMVIFNVMI